MYVDTCKSNCQYSIDNLEQNLRVPFRGEADGGLAVPVAPPLLPHPTAVVFVTRMMRKWYHFVYMFWHGIYVLE